LRGLQGGCKGVLEGGRKTSRWLQGGFGGGRKTSRGLQEVVHP